MGDVMCGQLNPNFKHTPVGHADNLGKNTPCEAQLQQSTAGMGSVMAPSCTFIYFWLLHCIVLHLQHCKWFIFLYY